MGRNHLAHASGDAINAVLAAAGYNFRRLLAWLKLLLLRILIALGLAAQLKIALKPSSSQTTKSGQRHDQSTVGPKRKRRDRPLDLSRVAHVNRTQLYSQ